MEREYFWLRMDHNFPLGATLPLYSKEEQKGGYATVHFIKTKAALEDTVFQDYLSDFVLSRQAHLVSDRLKKLLALYAPEMAWTPAVLVDHGGQPHPYWFLTPAGCPCLHGDTAYDIYGSVVAPVLEGAGIGGHSVFCGKTDKATLLFFRVDLVESILRRGFYGLGLKRVEVRE